MGVDISQYRAAIGCYGSISVSPGPGRTKKIYNIDVDELDYMGMGDSLCPKNPPKPLWNYSVKKSKITKIPKKTKKLK